MRLVTPAAMEEGAFNGSLSVVENAALTLGEK